MENQRNVETYSLDLYYTMHFPLTEKYIALYPKSAIESQEVLDKRERIRQKLLKEMLGGKKSASGSNAVEIGLQKTTAEQNTRESDSEDAGQSEVDDEEDEFLNMSQEKE